MNYALWKLAAVFGLAATITCVLFVDFCNLVYGCGCQSLWKAFDTYCNIHHGPKHCPWCTHGGVGFIISGGFVLATQALVVFKGFGFALLTRFGIALALFPSVGGLAAFVVGFSLGYWS